MVKVNGQTVPKSYGSIADLPELIMGLDQDISAWPDGNYTADEWGWLHSFHLECGDHHTVNSVDIAHANVHGPRIFRQLNPQQKLDLAKYFTAVFKAEAPPIPAKATHPVPWKDVRAPDIKARALAQPAPHDGQSDRLKAKLDEMEALFASNILPAAQQDFFRQTLKPLIGQLSVADQMNLYQDLNTVDSLNSESSLADEITEILRDHQVGITIVALPYREDPDTFVWYSHIDE